jgi:AraC-like DNA-binding protein
VALLSVRAVIESRLSDPHLNATSVAEAAGVSIRYANALLAEQNTSIMRLVLAIRLSRCRQALEDPLQDNRTVSEIAYSWGFSDMMHFGRCFKAMYDVSPRDYRKKVQTARDGAPPFSRRASSSAVRQLFFVPIGLATIKIASRRNFFAATRLSALTISPCPTDACSLHGRQPVFPHGRINWRPVGPFQAADEKLDLPGGIAMAPPNGSRKIRIAS